MSNIRYGATRKKQNNAAFHLFCVVLSDFMHISCVSLVESDYKKTMKFQRARASFDKCYIILLSIS